MTTSVVVLLAVTLAVTACGSTAKPSAPLRAPVPDVQGMNAPDAAARLIDAHYCVRLKRGSPPADDNRPKPGSMAAQAQMPVQRQSPRAGSTPPRWSIVTLTVGGISKHATTYIDVWRRGAKIPCPKISTSG